jgi:hypothetical protein
MERSVRRRIALFAVLMLVPAAAQAQAPAPATSFAELASRLKTGETVSVTDNAGRVVKGRVQQVSDTILVLGTDQGDLSLAATDVQRIVRPRHPVRKGALIGLGVGFPLGALACVFCDAGEHVRNGFAVGSLGMGIGAALGAAFPKKRVVFERTVTGRPRAAMSPMLSPRGAGVLLQFRW